MTIKIKLGLVDSDRLYLKRLTEVFGKKYGSQIEVYSFDESPKATELISESRVNVLVVSQDSKINAESLPESCMFAYFSESPDIETYNGSMTLFRYQRADSLYRKIIGMYSEKIADRVKYRSTGDRARISLFLPECEGAGAFTAAAAFSEYCTSEGRRTLFLNLRQFHSHGSMFTAPGESTFTDVIFAVKSRKANMRLKLESIVKRNGNGVYFFGDCRNPLDTTELKPDELCLLLDELSGNCGYDNIVIAGDFLVSESFERLLEYSDDVVIVSGNSRTSEIRLRQKQAAVMDLEKRTQTGLAEKLKVIFNRAEGMAASEMTYLGCVPDTGSDDEREAVRGFLSAGVFRSLFRTEVLC